MRIKSIFACYIAILFVTKLFAASGKIFGIVLDATDDQPLVGANIMLDGTALGASTDVNGEFFISQVPVGEYSLHVTYIGYKDVNIPIIVSENQTTKQTLKLEFDALEGEVVTVTAQAEGQMRAINQQLSSNTISNIVSAERIQELPDANAAESVGRLPGISIIRDGGEANKIVVRGLSPTYNSITIGGDKVPATDLDDRGVDLSMISPEILEGIEVTKALTPDQDADAFGGTVNFKLSDAPEGGFHSNIRFHQAYNNYRDDYGIYKGNVILSNRFWNEKLGVLVTGNIERTQRGSDKLSIGYFLDHEKRDDEDWSDVIFPQSVDLEYVDEIRDRMGFSLMMDYKFDSGKINFNNFVSRLDRHELIRTDRYDTDSNNHSRRFRERKRNIEILTNSIAGEHDLFFGNIDWRLSSTRSETKHPLDSRFRFRENGAFDAGALVGARTADEIISAAYNNLDKSFAYEGELFPEKSLEADESAQINVKIPFTLTTQAVGFVKFGGKYLSKTKNRDKERLYVRLDVEQGPAFEKHHSRYNDPDFEYIWTANDNGSIYNYLSPNFKIKSFMDGQFDDYDIFDVGLSRSELNYFLNTYLRDSLYSYSSAANLDDYETTENVSAGYIMTELNFGSYLMFLPGVRYEKTNVIMTGRQGFVPREFDEPGLDNSYVSDTTATNTYDRWFPMVHVRVRPTDWFDIRLAYTRTLSRPQLNWMLPKRKVNGSEYLIELGRPDLKPQISNNYDLFLSFYGNYVGLFTLGGFYKEIDDLIFNRVGHQILTPAQAIEEGFPGTYSGLTLDRPENNPFTTTLKGMEVEWQTNLHWLPSPFDGLVLNVNYSHIWSKTRFPRSLVLTERIPTFPFIKTSIVDTFRTGNMPNQADDIANFSLGYDKGPISARLSMLFQGRTLKIVGERPEYDGYTADLVRWDLSIKYRLSKPVSIFFNLNNFTNRPDESFQKASQYQTAKELYGWTTDVGLGFSF